MIDRNMVKHEITGQLISILKEKQLPLKSEIIDEMIPVFWSTGRSGNSLRLTPEGRSAFNAAGYKSYDFPVGNLVWESKLNINVESSKKLNCPYYFWLKHASASKNDTSQFVCVTVYDEKVAIMISIYGDLIQFLENSGDIND